MGRKRAAPPPIDKIEQDFLDAIQRLRDGAPKNKELRALKARGRLKINVLTVAKEAKRSRTLIALENCKYPRVRAQVLVAKEGRAEDPQTSSELIDKLRADLAETRAELKLAKAHTVAHYLAKTKAEEDLERLKAKYNRLLSKQGDDQGSGDNVVPIRLKKG